MFFFLFSLPSLLKNKRLIRSPCCVSVCRVGLGKLLLAHGRTAILGSQFHGTRDHTVLSHDSGSYVTNSAHVSVGVSHTFFFSFSIWSLSLTQESWPLVLPRTSCF
jgi:hypothetical protein